MYKNLEQLITKAVTQNSFDYELKYVAEFYGDDVDKNNLAIQLNILATDYRKFVHHRAFLQLLITLSLFHLPKSI